MGVKAVSRCTPDVVDALVGALVGPPAVSLLAAVTAVRRAAPDRAPAYATVKDDWRRLAEEGREPYAAAVARLDEARLALALELLTEIRQLSRSGTKEDATKLNAVKWQLEKMFPGEFGTARVEVTGRNGAAIRHQVDVDLDALDARIAALALAGAAAGAPADGAGGADDDGAGGAGPGDDDG